MQVTQLKAPENFIPGKCVFIPKISTLCVVRKCMSKSKLIFWKRSKATDTISNQESPEFWFRFNVGVLLFPLGMTIKKLFKNLFLLFCWFSRNFLLKGFEFIFSSVNETWLVTRPALDLKLCRKHFWICFWLSSQNLTQSHKFTRWGLVLFPPGIHRGILFGHQK